MFASLRRPAAVLLLLLSSACSNEGPRVVMRNDSNQSQHLFYCSNADCTMGVSGNDMVLKPGEEATDYWNSPDSGGLLGVASYPGDLLIGCLPNPSQGEDNPPTLTIVTSAATACSAEATTHSKVTLKNP